MVHSVRISLWRMLSWTTTGSLPPAFIGANGCWRWATWPATTPANGWLARGLEGQCCLGLHPSLSGSSYMEQVLARPVGRVAPLEFAEREQQLLSPVCKLTVLGFSALWFRWRVQTYRQGNRDIAWLSPALSTTVRDRNRAETGSQSSGAAGPAAASLGSREPAVSGSLAANAQSADVRADSCELKSFPVVDRLAL